MPGFPELLVIIIILLIVFGAKALPDLGEAIGLAIVKHRAARAPQPPPRERGPTQPPPEGGTQPPIGT